MLDYKVHGANALMLALKAPIGFSCKIPEYLYIELREQKAKTQFDWSEFLMYLCNTNSRPKELQRNYKIKKSKKIHKFTIRITSEAWITFQTFSAVFIKREHVLDFLIKEEKNKIGFLPSLT